MTQIDDAVPAVTYAAIASVPVVEPVAPAPAVLAAPAPVAEHVTPVTTDITHLLEPPLPLFLHSDIVVDVPVVQVVQVPQVQIIEKIVEIPEIQSA